MRFPVSLFISVGLVAGCAQNVPLKPAPAAETTMISGEGRAAIEEVSGVRVAVIPRAWPGDARISNAVTPVKVLIQNNSAERILVRYSELKLVGPAGQAFVALPPHNIDASVAEPRLSPGYAPVTAPGFAGTGFGVAPLYSPMYPAWPSAAGGFYYDPFYYRNYGNYWRQVELPTPEMLQRALPEGSIDAGGKAEGYLYFQKVNEELPRVMFQMDVLKAERGGMLGAIEIPLVVTP